MLQKELEPKPYVLVDSVPEFAMARSAVRHHAMGLLDERKQQIASGLHEGLPLQIDALSTANAVLNEPEDSPEYSVKLQGLRLDCRRLIGEWYRKRTWEYFPKSRHYFNAETGEFFSHGLSVRQMTENALTPHIDNAEEETRRINERVEDETPLIVRKLGGFALGASGIRTISECTDKAMSDYAHDMATGSKHRGYGGYVPEIEKLMIRDITIDEETGDRLEEQIGLPGTYINHYVIQEALRRRNIDVRAMDKTELHGAQILINDDILEFVKLLDEVASEEWLTEIYMGEPLLPGQTKDYSNVRQEAVKRQEQLAAQADMVADFILELAKSQTDPRKAPEIVEEFVKQILLNLATYDQDIAKTVFDEKTAEGLRRVAYLRANGQEKSAQKLLAEVKDAAPGGGYCGAGSCGLEALSSGLEAEDVRKLGFNPKDTIKDTERKCSCGGTVYYELKQTKKGCTSCGKTASY